MKFGRMIMERESPEEQVCICNSILDEEVAHAVLQARDTLLPKIRSANAASLAIVAELGHRTLR